MKWIIFVACGIFCLFFSQPLAEAVDSKNCVKWTPGHYVYIPKEFKKINLEEFIGGLDEVFKGVQVKFSWRELEENENQYNFDEIETLLKILKKYKKKLFLQIQERSYIEGVIPIPDYLYKEPQYQGGAALFDAPYRLKKGKKGGEGAKIWNASVLSRFNLLVESIGKRFDGEEAFEGINFPETAFPINRREETDFTDEKYLEALKLRLNAAKRAFRQSVVIQYVNYMEKDRLEKLIQFCYKIGVGIGGPDLVPDSGRAKGKERIPAYEYYPLYAGRMPLGAAVQLPNFTRKNGNFDLDKFWEMGLNTLKLNYIFWALVEGRQYTHSFRRDIEPYIKNKDGEINDKCPENLIKCCK